MAIKTMTIKDSNDFYVSIKNDENIVLVLAVCSTLFAHELDLFVNKFGLMLPRKMTVHVLFFEKRFAHVEYKFLLQISLLVQKLD